MLAAWVILVWSKDCDGLRGLSEFRFSTSDDASGSPRTEVKGAPKKRVASPAAVTSTKLSSYYLTGVLHQPTMFVAPVKRIEICGSGSADSRDY